MMEITTKGNGGSLFCFFQDVDNTFPSMWQDGVEWVMRMIGVRGKLWRVVSILDQDVRARVGIGTRESNEFDHEGGAEQGSVSAPNVFILLQRKVMEEGEKEMKGVVVSGRGREGGGEIKVEVKCMNFVDDWTKVDKKDGYQEIKKWLEVREVIGAKWKMKWKKKKDQVLVRGKFGEGTFVWNQKGKWI